MRFCLIFLSLAVLLSGEVVSAKQPVAAPVQSPPLQDLLLRLQQNLWDYLATVPDFFADEHVVSVMKQEGARDVKTTTDSIFRLKRIKSVGEAPTFDETREVKTVNKRAAKGDQLTGPAIFTGGFSTAAGIVSLEMSRCYDYTLQPPTQLNNALAFLIEYALKRDLTADDSCPVEKESGRAWIDPASFHVIRVEMTVPSHKDNNGKRVLWTWSVDFAPVTFDAKQFWMPSTIISNAEANDASGTWQFTATYTNYHKMNVSSRIVPDVTGNPK